MRDEPTRRQWGPTPGAGCGHSSAPPDLEKWDLGEAPICPEATGQRGNDVRQLHGVRRARCGGHSGGTRKQAKIIAEKIKDTSSRPSAPPPPADSAPAAPAPAAGRAPGTARGRPAPARPAPPRAGRGRHRLGASRLPRPLSAAAPPP